MSLLQNFQADADGLISSASHSEDLSVVYMPTGAGARGLKEYIDFTVVRDSFQQSLVKKREIVSLSVCGSLVCEESILDIVFQYGKEDYLSWIVPGLKLVSPTSSATASVMMITLAFGDRCNKISSIRVYWDQATVLNQLSLVQKLVDSNIYELPKNYQLPILSIDPKSIITDFDLNPLKKVLDLQPSTRHESLKKLIQRKDTLGNLNSDFSSPVSKSRAASPRRDTDSVIFDDKKQPQKVFKPLPQHLVSSVFGPPTKYIPMRKIHFQNKTDSRVFDTSSPEPRKLRKSASPEVMQGQICKIFFGDDGGDKGLINNTKLV